MKAFYDFKNALFDIKKHYLKLPKTDRRNFLENYKQHKLFDECTKHLKELDYTVVGIKDEKDSEKFFLSNEVDYSNLLDDRDHVYNIGVFFIPKGLYLPPHDHPDMLVMSKVLFGEISMVSLDEKDGQNTNSKEE